MRKTSTTEGSLPTFHSCLELACAVSGMRVALVGDVDAQEWRAIHALDRAGLGISAGLRLELANTFCRDVVTTREAVAFADYQQDPAHCSSPIPATHGFRSYVSVPIVLGDGRIYGTLCTLDPEPRPVTDEVMRALHVLASVVAAQVDAHHVQDDDGQGDSVAIETLSFSERRLQASEQLNSQLRQEGREREEFIAVLAHDLRNPLQAIRVTADLLGLSATTEAQQNLLRHLDDSTDRMAELIDVTLDFARGRLGSGLALRIQPCRDLADALTKAARQALAPYPGCPLQVDMNLPAIVHCDADRLCQLVGNLVINAAIHGSKGQRITLQGHSEGDALVLAVQNQGMIAPESMDTLFQPFHRSSSQKLDSGLGLGLYIASQIAVSHGGTLTANSSADAGTTFTARLPRVR